MPPAEVFSALCIKRTNNLDDFHVVVNHHTAMQDRTIDNALLALAKQGGAQGRLAEGLLLMRDVSWSGITQHMPMQRGGTKRLVLDALSERPNTSAELGRIMRNTVPNLSHRDATNRAYQALLRLESTGKVRREGRLWALT